MGRSWSARGSDLRSRYARFGNDAEGRRPVGEALPQEATETTQNQGESGGVERQVLPWPADASNDHDCRWPIRRCYLRENWRTRQDSNLWPPPSEGGALSS